MQMGWEAYEALSARDALPLRSLLLDVHRFPAGEAIDTLLVLVLGLVPTPAARSSPARAHGAARRSSIRVRGAVNTHHLSSPLQWRARRCGGEGEQVRFRFRA